MIPKKLFTPKCLHPDRNIVFYDDLMNFFNNILENLSIKENIITKDLELNYLFNFKTFKIFYKNNKISMLHFSRSKEENAKEYYETLFGEIQNIFFLKKFTFLNKIFSIFLLYSLYLTQNFNTFYQINITLEFLIEINNLIKNLFNNKKIEIAKEIFYIILKLKKLNAFSIGILPGLKTIVLNKYGLPIEQKNNIYKDYCEIFNYKNDLKKIEKDKNEIFDIKILNDYNNLKKGIIKDIKLNSVMFHEDYVNFMNNNIKIINNNNKNIINNNNNSNFNSDFNNFYDNENIINNPYLTIDDMNNNTITNLDCLFNQLI